MNLKKQCSIYIIEPVSAVAAGLVSFYEKDTNCRLVRVESFDRININTLLSDPCIVLASITSNLQLTFALDFLEAIKLKEETNKIKVLLVVKQNLSLSADEARKLKICEVITEPVTTEEVIRIGKIQLNAIRKFIDLMSDDYLEKSKNRNASDYIESKAAKPLVSLNWIYKEELSISHLPGSWIKTEDGYFFLNRKIVSEKIRLLQEALPLMIYRGDHVPIYESQDHRWRFLDIEPERIFNSELLPKAMESYLSKFLIQDIDMSAAEGEQGKALRSHFSANVQLEEKIPKIEAAIKAEAKEPAQTSDFSASATASQEQSSVSVTAPESLVSKAELIAAALYQGLDPRRVKTEHKTQILFHELVVELAITQLNHNSMEINCLDQLLKDFCALRIELLNFHYLEKINAVYYVKNFAGTVQYQLLLHDLRYRLQRKYAYIRKLVLNNREILLIFEAKHEQRSFTPEEIANIEKVGSSYLLPEEINLSSARMVS